MEILKRKFEINELKGSNVQIGDVINLPEFTVPTKIVNEKNKMPMAFDEHTIKDTATVYNIKDNKIYLVFDHALFQSVIDLNNTYDWKDTQLCKYLTDSFQPAMTDAGIPATNVSLLSKDEVFGEYKLPFFKEAKNRIVSDISEKSTLGYWLKTSILYNFSEYFCLASNLGCVYCGDASLANVYIRPHFVIEL